MNTDDAALVKLHGLDLVEDMPDDTLLTCLSPGGATVIVGRLAHLRALKARLAGEAVAARVDYYVQVGGDKYHVFPDTSAPSPTTPALTLGDYKDPARAEAAEQAVAKIAEIERELTEAAMDYSMLDEMPRSMLWCRTLLDYIRTRSAATTHNPTSSRHIILETRLIMVAATPGEVNPNG